MNIKTIDKLKLPEGVRIPLIGGFLYKIISNWERKEIISLPVDYSLNCEKRNETIIVSLTTIPSRIHVVELALNSIFRQSMKPDRIVLWLAKDQFPDFVPSDNMKKMIESGLEIHFCDDLKSHKKYYYSLLNQKQNELVITYDDDIIYPEDSIKRLYDTHVKYPDCIVCHRAGCSSSEKGKFTPYHSWKVLSSVGVNKPSTRLFPSTGGGTLYPFDSVNHEVYNKDNMMKSSFSADDLWVRFMSALNQTKIIKTRKYHKTFTTIEGSQIESLQVLNCLNGENDRVIDRLSQCYPEGVRFILGDSE